MKVGDLVKFKNLFTSHGIYEGEKYKIGMIIEEPNEVAKIRVLLSNGDRIWVHCAEIEYIGKHNRYLKE